MKELKSAAGTYLRTLMTAFLVLIFEHKTLAGLDWLHLIEAACISSLPVVINYLNPKDNRYGIKNTDTNLPMLLWAVLIGSLVLFSGCSSTRHYDKVANDTHRTEKKLGILSKTCSEVFPVVSKPGKWIDSPSTTLSTTTKSCYEIMDSILKAAKKESNTPFKTDSSHYSKLKSLKLDSFLNSYKSVLNKPNVEYRYRYRVDTLVDSAALYNCHYHFNILKGEYYELDKEHTALTIKYLTLEKNTKDLQVVFGWFLKCLLHFWGFWVLLLCAVLYVVFKLKP